MWVPDDETVALLERCHFPDRDTVTCAVSGGADSSALLVLAVASGRHVTAVHVDHGLRPGSEDEAGRVAALADRLGATFRSETVSVEPGPNLEERCRDARRAALPPDVLYGHTLDDQAETVLWHVLRGAGRSGIAAMRDRQHPLLELRRADTVELCQRLDIDVVVDPTNQDVRLTRNLIRHDVFPLIERSTGRDPRPPLARLARIAADEDDLLELLAAELEPTDAAALAAAPVALARRAVRRWLREADDSGRPPPFDAVERVLAVARKEAVGTEVPGGLQVRRHRGRLSLLDTGTGEARE